MPKTEIKDLKITEINDLKNLLFNVIVCWYEDAMLSYTGIDDPDFRDRVCKSICISEEDYNSICHLTQPDNSENE